jgi:hypothetical protein
VTDDHQTLNKTETRLNLALLPVIPARFWRESRQVDARQKGHDKATCQPQFGITKMGRRLTRIKADFLNIF